MGSSKRPNKYFKIIKNNDRSSSKLKLIIVGKKGWMYEEIFTEAKKRNMEEEIVFTDFIKDETLALFYKNARCLVLPSLYEGFGLPVIEAMASGCPVVVSKNSSLEEIGGKSAFYLDPFNVENIAGKILEVLTADKYKINARIKSGLDQVKKYDWLKCSDIILETLENINNQN